MMILSLYGLDLCLLDFFYHFHVYSVHVVIGGINIETTPPDRNLLIPSAVPTRHVHAYELG
jgi:hypothetical protein